MTWPAGQRSASTRVIWDSWMDEGWCLHLLRCKPTSNSSRWRGKQLQVYGMSNVNDDEVFSYIIISYDFCVKKTKEGNWLWLSMTDWFVIFYFNFSQKIRYICVAGTALARFNSISNKTQSVWCSCRCFFSETRPSILSIIDTIHRRLPLNSVKKSATCLCILFPSVLSINSTPKQQV